MTIDRFHAGVLRVVTMTVLGANRVYDPFPPIGPDRNPDDFRGTLVEYPVLAATSSEYRHRATGPGCEQ